MFFARLCPRLYVSIDGFPPNFCDWYKDELIRFWVKRSKVKVRLSRRRRPALDIAVEFGLVYN